MRRMVLAAVAIGAAVLLTGRARDRRRATEHSDKERVCSEATLRGSYGIQLQGTRPAPPPAAPGTIESVIGVIVRHYDGEGNFTQVGNEKASVSGQRPGGPGGRRHLSGERGLLGHAPMADHGSTPITLTDRFVIVDRGREVRNFIVDPAPVMVTSVSRKVAVP